MMNRNVILTCALTGSSDTASKSQYVPVTPKEIAESGIEAAQAGATVLHIHVRDPETKKGSRKLEYYREVVGRIRDSGVDVIINLTGGMGGTLEIRDEDPSSRGPLTDLVGAKERLAHVAELRPEICTLDCGTINLSDSTTFHVGTPELLRVGARYTQEIGVKPEMEVFDTGHVWLANTLVEEKLIDSPPLYQLCMGIRYGAPANPRVFAAMVDMLPADAQWTSFSIGAVEFPWVAQSVLMGGNVHVGLEDNLLLSRGVKGSNAQLVAKAKQIIELLGARVVSPDEARDTLGLKNQTK